MKTAGKPPVGLVILDGFGLKDDKQGNANLAIYVLDSKQTIEITPPNTRNCFRPDWHPSGNWILTTWQRPGANWTVACAAIASHSSSVVIRSDSGVGSVCSRLTVVACRASGVRSYCFCRLQFRGSSRTSVVIHSVGILSSTARARRTFSRI